MSIQNGLAYRKTIRTMVGGLLAAMTTSVIADGVSPETTYWVERKAAYTGTVVSHATQWELMTQTGYRRTFETQRYMLSEAMSADTDGKALPMDVETGELLIEHITDQLPIGWRLSYADENTDSLGRPIVNRITGLPAWSQYDVDALRDAIQSCVSQHADGTSSAEADRMLGNLIGQAFVRRIDISDLHVLENSDIMTAHVVESIVGLVTRYEATKLIYAADFGGVYSDPAYLPEAEVFFTAFDFDPESVPQQTEDHAEGGVADSNCYQTNSSPRGITVLTGSTILWDRTGTDDATADVPLGFDFRAFPCEDRDANLNVRISTNGLLSFFEQGGAAATEVYSWLNQPLPHNAAPNGFIAPWWDDLIVEMAQGEPDRIHYKTEGARPNRIFTTEWSSMSRLGGSNSDFHWFQVKLYEKTGRIEIVIDVDQVAARDPLDSATVGIENFDATDADYGPSSSNNIAWDHPLLRLHRYLTRLTANDDCSYAIEVFNGQMVTADLITAWLGPAAVACGSSGDNRDVWYRFVAPMRGVLRLDACGTYNAGGADSVLTIYSSCTPDGPSLLACNDDRITWADAPINGCHPLDSYVAAILNPNQEVFIRVSHYYDELRNAYVDMQVHFLRSRRGDLNCDGRVNNFDIDPFVELLSDPAAWMAAHPSCDPTNGDINGDGYINNFDIDAFVDCLASGGC